MSTPLIPSMNRRAMAALSAVLLLAGCKKTAAVEPVVAAALTVVQGNSQTVQAGKELPSPIVLRVTDKAGTALPDIPVSLVVSAGGGSVLPASGVSDAQGEYRAKWTVGPSLPVNQLVASVPGVDPVKIDALGVLPSDIVVAQGNNQSAKNGAALTTSIVVRVVGAGNVPMAGVTVLFQVTSGGGAISPNSAVTSSLGEVTVKWTLGPSVGTQTASVSASVLSPVVLSATSTP